MISTSQAGTFKPHVATYRMGAEQVGAPPDRILYVAGHAFDCIGAKAYGMRTCFVNRRTHPFSVGPFQPDFIVNDLAELVARLT